MSRRHYTCRITTDSYQAYCGSPWEDWQPLKPSDLWNYPNDESYVSTACCLDSDLADSRNKAVYTWFIYATAHWVGCVYCGLARLTVERKSDPLRLEDYIEQQNPRAFENWVEWHWIGQPLGDVPLPSDLLDIPLRNIGSSSPLWPELEAIINRVEAEAAAPIPAAAAAAYDAAQPPMIANPTPSTSASVSAIDRSIRETERSLAFSRIERAHPTGPGFVYVIEMKDCPHPYYKIGMTKDLDSRLQTLQTGNPYLLSFARTLEVSNMLRAESFLHSTVEATPVPNIPAREWFEFRNGLDPVDEALESLPGAIPSLAAT